MWKKALVVLLGICVLLSACGQNRGKQSAVHLSSSAQEYETLSYGEFKKRTGTEAGFYHAQYYCGEIPDSPLEVIYAGEYDEDLGETVPPDDNALPVRLQGSLDALMEGIREEMSLTGFSEALFAEGAAKAVLTRLEGAGTAYYVGNDFVNIQFDSDQDGELDRLLSISLDESTDAAIDPKSAAWLEIDRQVN